MNLIKYANRKLYDTNTSRYVTLVEVYRTVVDGGTFTCHDHDTGKDITDEVYTSVLKLRLSKMSGKQLLEVLRVTQGA